MNKINMNRFGMPKSGMDVVREQMFGGMSLEDGPQVPDLELPEFGNVAEEPVRIMGGTKKMVDTAKGLIGEDGETNWRLRGLQSLVLYDKDDYFRESVGKHPELGYMVPDRVRADKKGFNMLLGAELSQVIGKGDTYSVLQVTINAMPKEKQLEAKGRVQQCETEYQAQELLGELWSEVMVTGYDAKKAELEAEAAKKKERAEAALGEVNKWLDAGWVERVKSGVGGAPLSDWTKAEAVQSGAMTAEQVAELDETTARAQQAFELLMVTMGGRMLGTGWMFRMLLRPGRRSWPRIGLWMVMGSRFLMMIYGSRLRMR